jgi:hypothetical protein
VNARAWGAVFGCSLLLVSPPDPVRAESEARLVVDIGVLPQFEQFIGSDPFPTEMFSVEALLPLGARGGDRATARVAGRRDFMIVGAGLARDISVSSLREWRIALALDVTFPLGDAHDAYLRWHDGDLTLSDRLALRLGMGQTFDFADSRVGLRVGYDVRLTPRGSVLSVLEGLDDAVGDASTFAIHEIRAGLEYRLGGAR